jgi:preprotein translocase subunit SecD
MFRILGALSIAAVVLSGCGPQKPAPNATLEFYVVNEAETDGSRFIDTTNFPKLGYVSRIPDLAVTRIQGISRLKLPKESIMIDTNGVQTLVPASQTPALGISLNADDRKSFAVLTERSIGSKLLVQLGDKLLIAPKVVSPITGGIFQIDFHSQEELKQAEDELKKLVSD